MQYNGICLDTVVYNSLLDGLFKARKLTDACNLFQKMIEDDGVRASCWTYNILIDGLFKNGKGLAAYIYPVLLDEGLKLVEEMEVRGWKDSMEATMKAPQSREKDFTPIFPSNGDFGDILSRENFTDAGTDTALGAEDADIHYQETPKSNSTSTFPLTGGKQIDTKGADSFDIDMVNTLLSIFLAKGKLSMACKLFEIFTDMGADPASYTYNSMMSSFVKKGYFNEAWGVLQEMGEKVCPSDVATYNVIIQGLGKMGRADLAGAVLDKLMKQRGYLDIVVYNTLINALGNAGRIEEVNKLFQQMNDSGINPDLVAYNTLIEVHAKAGQLKQIL
ncbi:hypothetical protein P3L10_018135 [Capsicum annuum]